LAYEAETLLENTFGYVDYKYLINRKLRNARLCQVFADPVTFSLKIDDIGCGYFILFITVINFMSKSSNAFAIQIPSKTTPTLLLKITENVLCLLDRP